MNRPNANAKLAARRERDRERRQAKRTAEVWAMPADEVPIEEKGKYNTFFEVVEGYRKAIAEFKSGVLCAMAMKGPCDFDNGDIVALDKSNVSRQNSKENHHFFPYALHEQFGVSTDDINSVLNFAFISRRLNEEISKKRPSEYLTGYADKNPDFEAHLLSHYITSDALVAAKGENFQSFIQARGDALLEKINQLCCVGEPVDALVSDVEENDDDDEQGL